MAWTTPLTWSTGYLATASDLNTHIRDNETYLYSTLPYSCSQTSYNTTTRIATTTYQNTTGKILFVQATMNVVSDPYAYIYAYCNSTNTPSSTEVASQLLTTATSSTVFGEVSFVVPVNFYYIVTGASNVVTNKWVETILF